MTEAAGPLRGHSEGAPDASPEATLSPYPPVTSFLWTLLRDVVAGLLVSLAMAIGWFTGIACVGPEDWTARSLAFVTFLLLGTLSLMTLRALLLRAADTAVTAVAPERPRLLAESTAGSIGLGFLAGAGVPPLLGRAWSDAVGGIALCLGLPLVLIGAAALSVRWRIASRAARAPGGFDPRELDVPYAWWPLLVAAALLVASLGVGASFGGGDAPPLPRSARGGLASFRELPAAGLGFGELGDATPWVDEVRSRAECWRIHLDRPGVYRATVSAERFTPLLVLANEPRPSAGFRRQEGAPGSREASMRWNWDSQRAAFLIIAAAGENARGPYQVRVERLGP